METLLMMILVENDKTFPHLILVGENGVEFPFLFFFPFFSGQARNFQIHKIQVNKCDFPYNSIRLNRWLAYFGRSV